MEQCQRIAVSGQRARRATDDDRGLGGIRLRVGSGSRCTDLLEIGDARGTRGRVQCRRGRAQRDLAAERGFGIGRAQRRGLVLREQTCSQYPKTGCPLQDDPKCLSRLARE